MRIAALVLLIALAAVAAFAPRTAKPLTAAPMPEIDRSPVDLVLTPDESRLLCLNQGSGTVSLIDTESGRILAEVPCGERPSAIAYQHASGRVIVSSTWTHELYSGTLKGDTLRFDKPIRVGAHPRGVALSPDGATAYVALEADHEVAVVDLAKREVSARIAVGKRPRSVALTRDGKTLAVGADGDGGVAVVDVVAKNALYREDFMGLNLGQMVIADDQTSVYFPWMIYRHNPITANNIRIGWVLASRIARVRLDGKVRREAISLDPQGEAVADPTGLALSPDQKWMVCSSAGTHELLVYALPGLPLQDYGGPGDHIDHALLIDKKRFWRIPVGGRPMALRYSRDGKRVFVANYLLNEVQVVDITAKKVTRTFDVGGPETPSAARRGEAIFYDAKRSLDQWYSCHSCHYEGHTSTVTMDTRNDGRFGNFKTVLSLRNVTKTGPWFWHGWATDLDEALEKSLVDSMIGPKPTKDDVRDLRAFLDTLTPPRNPYREGKLTEAAARGEKLFRGAKADCARCHSGPQLTDGQIHEVGTGERGDVYKGYNTPSLRAVYDRPLLLHDGRSKTLTEMLKGPHSPEKVSGNEALDDVEVADLVEYLRGL